MSPFVRTASLAIAAAALMTLTACHGHYSASWYDHPRTWRYDRHAYRHHDYYQGDRHHRDWRHDGYSRRHSDRGRGQYRSASRWD